VSSPTPFDVDAYLRRIRFAEDCTPTLATLDALVRAHARHVPFENLDVLLHRPIRLDAAGVQDKLVRAGRGGYCFEHCTLVAAMLERIGFNTDAHTARVVLTTPRAQSPRTHMFVTVDVDGQTWVVDPGFGGLAPDRPVPLVERTSAVSGHTHWMARDDRYWVLRTHRHGHVVDCWATTLDADNPADFDLGNYYTSTHPQSPFVNRLMLRALTDDGSVAVLNRSVTTVRDGVVTHSTLDDRAALRALLRERFGFDLPEGTAMRVPGIPEWT
jgi:N-hydroxyarylamine O-acetyltransferase